MNDTTFKLNVLVGQCGLSTLQKQARHCKNEHNFNMSNVKISNQTIMLCTHLTIRKWMKKHLRQQCVMFIQCTCQFFRRKIINGQSISKIQEKDVYLGKAVMKVICKYLKLL